MLLDVIVGPASGPVPPQLVLNYFIPYIGLGQLKLTATEISCFFAFFSGLSALSNLFYFKYLVDRLNKRKAISVAALAGVGLLLT